MGTSFFQVGWQSLPRRGQGLNVAWGTREAETYELEQRSEAWNEARRRALDRVSEQAQAVGADAVIGVHLRRGRHDWAQGLVEFIATGTAVRSERFAIDDGPALSNLSGQEFSSLFCHGYWPVGLVAGSTVAYVASSSAQQYRSGSWAGGMVNQELSDFSQGVYDARDLAMERVLRQAHAQHARGVIGVHLDRSWREIDRDIGGRSFKDLMLEIHVIGTAIVELDRQLDPPPKFLDLQLNERPPR